MSILKAIESRFVAAAMKGPEDWIELPDGTLGIVVQASITRGTVTIERRSDRKKLTLFGSEVARGNPGKFTRD